MSPAKAAAFQLIDKYVERGDTIEQLRSHMGSSSPGGKDVSIGGYMPIGGKYSSCDWILVYRVSPPLTRAARSAVSA
jgi:hypothetical protein